MNDTNGTTIEGLSFFFTSDLIIMNNTGVIINCPAECENLNKGGWNHLYFNKMSGLFLLNNKTIKSNNLTLKSSSTIYEKKNKGNVLLFIFCLKKSKIIL